ncbi:MAG: 6-hydroxymethylpterin diphosphokinase MptE-like protein [Promethearchaeota archaeon]
MELAKWWPRYLAIVSHFGYSVEEDQKAAEILSQMLGDNVTSLSKLVKQVKSRNVLICGAGPSLPSNLDQCIKQGLIENTVMISADGATSALLEQKLQPDIIVTDLDGTIPDISLAQRQGTTVVIHAHGDNIPALKQHVPDMVQCAMTKGAILGSTQAQPRPGVINFGGFTDGDRCVFIAEALQAKTIALIGMDLGNTIGKYSKPELAEDVPATPVKREKLLAAKELLEWLATWSKSRLINLTGAHTKIQGIPDQSITKTFWDTQAD